MILPPGQKHFTEYAVSSLFSFVSVLYAVLKNSNCNRSSSSFTLKLNSFTTVTLYLLCLYLRYTQIHPTGFIFFSNLDGKSFLGFVQGLKASHECFFKAHYSSLIKIHLPSHEHLLFWHFWSTSLTLVCNGNWGNQISSLWLNRPKTHIFT